MCIFCRPFFSSAEGDMSSVHDTVWYAALFYNNDVSLFWREGRGFDEFSKAPAKNDVSAYFKGSDAQEVTD